MWTVTTFENHELVQRTYESRKDAHLDALDYHLRWFDCLREHLGDDRPPIFKKEWIKNYLQTIENLKEDLKKDNYDDSLYLEEEVILTNDFVKVKLVYTISDQELYFYTDMFEDANFVLVKPVFE